MSVGKFDSERVNKNSRCVLLLRPSPQKDGQQVLYIETGKQFIYRICSLFGGDFNLAVWRFFFCLPNLNYANIIS